MEGFIKEKEQFQKEKEDREKEIQELQNQIDDLMKKRATEEDQIRGELKVLQQNLNEEKNSRKSQERSSENISLTQSKIIDTLKENIKNLNLKLEDKHHQLQKANEDTQNL